MRKQKQENLKKREIYLKRSHIEMLTKVSKSRDIFKYQGRTSVSKVIRYILDSCSDMKDEEFFNFIKLYEEHI